MKSIIATLIFGALALFAAPTTASAKVKPGKTYKWVFQPAEVNKSTGKIIKYKVEHTFILKSKCKEKALLLGSRTETTHICIRKQP